jgi:hypothetical protein
MRLGWADIGRRWGIVERGKPALGGHFVGRGGFHDRTIGAARTLATL